MKKGVIQKAFAGMLAVMFLGLGACTKGPSNTLKSDAVLYSDGMVYTTTTKTEVGDYAALTFDYLGGETVMPIGGFYGPYATGGSLDGNVNKDLLSDEIFSALKDAGINMFVYNKDMWIGEDGGYTANKCIDLCEKYKIGYFVQSDWLEGQFGTKLSPKPVSASPLNTKEGIEKFQRILNKMTKNGTRKSVLGIHAKDEPFKAEIELSKLIRDVWDSESFNNYGLSLFGNSLGKWEGEWNLFGTCEPISYNDYFDLYIEKARPEMFSCTNYPFYQKDTPDSYLTLWMYDAMADIRSRALDTNLPFWRMMQAGGQWNDAATWIPSVEPYQNEAELLLDVNVSLAYGAKAIQYFTLVQPLHFAMEEGYKYDYERNGLIGADGHLTRWYYYAQRANKQVQAIDEYLMLSSSEGLIVHGKDATKMILTDSQREDDGTYINSGKYKEMIGIEGDDCLVGCFNYKGGTALYVVNTNRYAKANTLVKFDDTYRYTVIQRADEADVVGSSIPLTLDAGEGALIVLY